MKINSSSDVLFELPEPSGWVGQPARVALDGSTATLKLATSSGGELAIEFQGVRAFRHSVEQLADPKIVAASYDKVVSVRSSPWLEDARALAEQRGGWDNQLHHYALFLDGGGSYECVAESWSASP